MSCLTDIKYKQTYNKIDDNIANDFYLPSMANSNSYCRLSGYFGSTVFIIAWSALKTFVLNGGRMKLICSPILSEQDIDAILKGEKGKADEIVRNRLAAELEELWRNEHLRNPFKVLAALISSGNIEIKVAYGRVSASDSRLFHDKTGIFSDGVNYVSFRGSVNETFKGLSNSGNIESISVFTSWSNESDLKRVTDDCNLFNRLWNNQASGVTVIPLPHDIKERLKQYSKGVDWINLIEEVQAEVEHTQSISADKKGGRLPRHHQKTALDNWIKNNHRGVLEHATGSGKTFTSLCAIRYSIEKKKSILILVPSTELLSQWYDEVKETLADLNPTILQCGDGNIRWKRNGTLNYMTSPYTKSPKITISTMDTAVTPEFLKEINSGEHLFVVADEVHRMGTPKRRAFFFINAGYRLGVSATPKRYGDEIGTEALLNYFGGILQPIYSLQDAIKDQVLTPYFYCPKVVSLNEEEQAEWLEISKKIRDRFLKLQSSDLEISSDDKFKKLLLQRSRIIKKAKSKVNLALEIVGEHYKKGQKWIVYCEDKTQLFAVRDLLMAKLPDIDVLEYYSDMDGDKAQTLKYFSDYGGVIVSIRCLDEGVDIPSTTHAVILASSKNPREFTQRRGRVLRRYPGKVYSWVYDAIVVPNDISENGNKLDPLIVGELSRAIQFADWSDSCTAKTWLLMIAAKHNIKYEETAKLGLEDE